MKGFGLLLAVLGAFGMLLGFGMDTSVSGGVGSFGRVANLSLMQQQAAVLTASGALFLAGCLLNGLGHVRDAVREGAAATTDRLASLERALASSIAGAPAAKHDPSTRPLADTAKPPVRPTQAPARRGGQYDEGEQVKHPGYGAGIYMRPTRVGSALVRFQEGDVEVSEDRLQRT